MAPDSTTDDTKEIQQAGGNATSDDAAMGLDQPPSQERDKPVEIQSKGLADLPGAQLPGDSQTIDFESQSQKIDGKGLDDPNQEQDSVILKERSLAVKAQPQEEGVTGPEEMDINTGLTHVESSSVIEPTEGKLICEVNEIEEKCLSKEMPALELVTEDETKKMEVELSNEVEGEFVNPEQNVQPEADVNTATNVFLPDKIAFLGNESETQENQVAFMKELEAFHKERFLEFKPPKFYGEPLNCLKLWRAVIKLGGYEQVTASKLWRQVGESFNPPKTCTTVSWTFRGFYEKAKDFPLTMAPRWHNPRITRVTF